MLAFMYLTYLVVGSVFVVAVCAVVLRLFLATRRRRASSRLLGQEFVWTLVPALVVVGLTVLGEIPHGWAKLAAGPRGAEIRSRLVR